MIIPSIDLMQGKAVKLIGGDPKRKAFERDALELAREFSIYPEINLIDLDSALGKGENLDLIREICRICVCNVGGGIRSVEKAYQILKYGAKNLIIGTKATEEFLIKLPKERIILALDSRNGKVVEKGWTIDADESPVSRAMRLERFCSGFLYTSVDDEGRMDQIDLRTPNELRRMTLKRILYAGGISTNDQINELSKLDIDAVLGMSYYSGKIDLKEAFTLSLDFRKGKGLIPTVVQDPSGNILMLTYSSPESVKSSLESRRCTYYSRTRKSLWVKGETSGNFQEILNIKTDCDKDALIYTARQMNAACHKGTYSCFNSDRFDLSALMAIISSRKWTNSYTDKLLRDENELKAKIVEEANEVIEATNSFEMIWEIADLLYFLSVFMVKSNISLRDIENELSVRNLMKNNINTTKLG